MTEPGGEIVTSVVSWDTSESSSESLGPSHSISVPSWDVSQKGLSDTQEDHSKQSNGKKDE